MKRRRGYALLLLLVADALATGARAQTASGLSPIAPSQVTPPSFQPAPPQRFEPEPTLSFGGPGATAPAGSDTLSVVVEDVIVDGEFAELEEARQQITAAMLGRKLTVAQIFQAAGEIEAAYAQAGYVFVRITVPPQRISAKGPVRFVLVDGFVEAIDAGALNARVRNVVRARLQDLVGVRRLQAATLERRLLIAGDVAGLRLRSVLTRGEHAGGVKLVLDGDHRLVTGQITSDNRNGVSLGRWQFGTSIAVNSLSGGGEQVFASLASDSNLHKVVTRDPRLRIFGAGVMLPIGVDGLTATPEYSHSRTHARATSGALDSIGEFERWTLRFAAPLLRSRAQNLNVSVAAERLKQVAESTLFRRDTSRDEYAVLRGSLDWSTSTSVGGGVSTSLTATRGLGGRDRDDARRSAIPLSRQGADPEFTKAGFSAQIVQPLPLGGLRATVAVAGQTSFNAPLLRSEQLALDGSTLVSGVAAGALSVDRGIAARAELSRPLTLQTRGGAANLTPYIFTAFGAGFLELPTALESARLSGRSFGGGVRFDLGDSGGMPGLNIALEVARHASYMATTKRGSRVGLSVASRF